MKIWNLKVQKNLNIEKMKFLAMHIAIHKWSFDKITVRNVQKILVELPF